MLVETPVHHLLRGGDDGRGAWRIEQAAIAIGFRGDAFDQGQRMDERQRHTLAADAEIFQRALRLRAPVAARLDFDRPETIGLGALTIDGRLGRIGHCKLRYCCRP